MDDPGIEAVLLRMPEAVGSLFTFRQGAGTPGVGLTLVGVEARGGGAAYMQSSAYFEGPATTPLPQATYLVEHPLLGTFALFIVPIARRDDTLRYEACFTRER